MEKKTGFFNGILHIFYALNYSLQGLFTAFRLSTAIKQEFLVLFLLGALGWYTQKVWYLAAASIIAWLFVIVTELLNSAIEEGKSRQGHGLCGSFYFGFGKHFCAVTDLSA